VRYVPVGFSPPPFSWAHNSLCRWTPHWRSIRT
jgi:hypothetical protein